MKVLPVKSVQIITGSEQSNSLKYAVWLGPTYVKWIQLVDCRCLQQQASPTAWHLLPADLKQWTAYTSDVIEMHAQQIKQPIDQQNMQGALHQ